MNRSFLLVVLLFLFPSDQFQTQTATSKTQSGTGTHKAAAKTAPGSNEANPEAESLYRDGIERLEMGQVSEAVERFQNALKIDPEYIAAYSALGRAFFKLRQWDNASETLRRALALKAKKRESENKPQKNEGAEPDVPPAAPASKPKGISSNSADNPKTLALVRNTPLKHANLDVVTKQPNVNKPLPALPINAAIAVTTLRPALTPPQVAPAEPGAGKNLKFDDLLGSPPPALREQADAVEPAAPIASAVLESTVPRNPAAIEIHAAMNVKPLPPRGESITTTAASPTPLSEDMALTTIYRVGSRDVLEVRLNSSQPQQTTVFTVTQSGLLEHPQLSGPLPVTGLTVEEIRARVENDLKNQASIESPKAFVRLVEYASHSVVVDGLVKHPGTKSLKSEAVPLAVVVAEAQPLPHAARVTVVRNTNQILETDLNFTADSRLLVRPGDVVTLHPQINETLYVGGKVKFPGEKTYRVGLTLMQAILMAGGATSNASVAEIVRDGDDVVGTRFDLKAIEAGKAADPLIKARDRIILR